MKVELGNNTSEMINQLGMKLEEYGGNLFEIAIKQRNVHIAEWGLTLLLTIAVFYFAIRAWKWTQGKDNYDDWVVGVKIFSVVICTLISVLFIILTYTMIQWILNPEYAAIQEIRNLLG